MVLFNVLICLSIFVGTSADWWSVGVILFELIVGIPPFNAEHPQVLFNLNFIHHDFPRELRGEVTRAKKIPT